MEATHVNMAEYKRAHLRLAFYYQSKSYGARDLPPRIREPVSYRAT